MLLRKRSEDILNMADKTVDEFKSLWTFTGGDVWVGCAESEGIKHLAWCFKILLERYPVLHLHLQSGNSAVVTGQRTLFPPSWTRPGNKNVCALEKYQMFSPAVKVLLDGMKKRFELCSRVSAWRI